MTEYDNLADRKAAMARHPSNHQPALEELARRRAAHEAEHGLPPSRQEVLAHLDALDEELTWEQFQPELRHLEAWISHRPRKRAAWLYSVQQWAERNR
jgi:hypothetical protein